MLQEGGGGGGRGSELHVHVHVCMINTQTLEKDKLKERYMYTNQIPRQQPFKEKLLPRVGLKPMTFSVLG